MAEWRIVTPLWRCNRHSEHQPAPPAKGLAAVKNPAVGPYYALETGYCVSHTLFVALQCFESHFIDEMTRWHASVAV